METIGIIGCGNMGGAIAKAISLNNQWHVLVYDIRSEQAQMIASQSNARACTFDELMKQSSVVILAVKPQVLPDLYETLANKGADKRWISLAAGVPLETLEQRLHTDQIVRIMPNIGASVGKAVTAVTPHQRATAQFVELVLQLVRSFGSAHVLDERQLSAFIGVSGSAIATCFAFLDTIAMGGVHEGLSYGLSLSLIRQTMESALSLLQQTGQHPRQLITSVCSPAGTTIETIQVLADGAFEGTVFQSVIAASEKAKALEEQAKKGV